MQVDAVLLLAAFAFGLAAGGYIENKVQTKIAGNAIARIHKAKEKALAEIQQGKETNG